jgi:hypothetical protein
MTLSMSPAEALGRAFPVDKWASNVDEPGGCGPLSGVPGSSAASSTRESHDVGRVVAPSIIRVFSQPNTEGAAMTLPPDVLTRPCACGRSVTASRSAPFTAVSHHNRSPEHSRWWARVRDEWQGQP